jgi:hypothetical protein
MKRRPRKERRFLNSEESEAMGFVELQANADDTGWPYPDDDDEDTTERYRTPDGIRGDGYRKENS